MTQPQVVLDATGIQLTQSIVGWKCANAYVTHLDVPRLIFISAIFRKLYGVTASAICAGENEHVVPCNDCTCGFHAWHDAADAVNYLKEQRTCSMLTPEQARSNLTLQRVSLYGDVIEGGLHHAGPGWCSQWAYRAQNQQVHDIFFERKCYVCGAASARLGTNRASFKTKGDLDCYSLRPLCRDHMYRSIDETKVMARNNVNIHWHYPSE